MGYLNKVLENSAYVGIIFISAGLIGELKRNKNTISKCLFINGTIGCSLLCLDAGVKIIKHL
uniref:Uncharacterized protein n=1 Tax=viral metagenome TaxID=1070528 RepID=A0A6C0J9M9_9ZZZZ